MITLLYKGREATMVRTVKGQPKIEVEPGETFEISEELGEHLLTAYSRSFEMAEGGDSKKSAPKKEAPKKKETKAEKKAREEDEAKAQAEADAAELEKFKAMVDNRTPEQFEKLLESIDKAVATVPESVQEDARQYVLEKEAAMESEDEEGAAEGGEDEEEETEEGAE